MALVAVGAAGAAVIGSFVGIVYCVKRFSQPAIELTGHLTGKLKHVQSKKELEAMFAQ